MYENAQSAFRQVHKESVGVIQMKKNKGFIDSSRAVLCALLMLLFSSAAYAADRPLEGRAISVMGDSISTYMGWSDKYPIADESCQNRYGEPYYGPAGADVHNTDLLVTDTWWHQAATELGASILMSNAGNSTGLLHASYPANADWDLYLKELLAYKSRPYYMGRDGQSPDVIALYIGSNDVAKCKTSEFGAVDAVDFDALIQKTGSTYTYAEPKTVAEAYCILLHKLTVTYPDAEIYCFAVLPNAGGTVATINKRLAACVPFNDMIRGVAKRFGAFVVDLPGVFALDPDGDGVAAEEAAASFQNYFHNDPHPNAAGFDIITRAFVNAVKENSRYIVEVETEAGCFERIKADFTAARSGSAAVITGSASQYLTPNGMTVDYRSTARMEEGREVAFASHYDAVNASGVYHAEGGCERFITEAAPAVTLRIPLSAGTRSSASSADAAPITTGDPKAARSDGVYDCTITQTKAGSGASVTTTALSAAAQQTVSDVSIALKDRPQSAAANRDADPDNDVFTADLSFRLAVKPARLTVQLSGALQAGETRLACDAAGLYTLSGVTIAEGAGSIRFLLPQGMNTEELTLSFELAVDSDEVCVEHLWRTEEWTSTLPSTGDDMPIALLMGALLLSLTALVRLSRRRRTNG